jgi:uncharacterized membrane protein YgcG
MLGKLPWWRHAAVAAVIVGVAALGLFGVIGAGNRAERFDAKTIVVEPRPDGSIRVTEYVDQDFGRHRRHGYERVVPNDFGVPADVVASSPDAPDDVSVVDLGDRTRIRIGDPDTTIGGQHRYVLSYTYPDARLDEVGLALDIVAPEGGGWPGDQETGRMEIDVVGVELADPRCDTGSLGAVGGCELVRGTGGPPVYRAVLEPLPARDGVSIFGSISSFTDAAETASPPIPDRRPDRRGLMALALLPAGLLGAVPVYLRARRTGRNEVFAGGAADAAYGSLPPPGADPTTTPAVEWVTDDDMADLATIEFVPPKGIAPWEAAVLVRERIDDDTVAAWLSGLAGREAITLAEHGKDLEIASGPRRDELQGQDAALLDRILRTDPYVTGTYDKQFAAAWKSVQKHQRKQIAASGWWKHLAPGSIANPKPESPLVGVVALGLLILVFGVVGVGALLGLLRWWPVALVFAVLAGGAAAAIVYAVLLPSRSAVGSALALRAESFRRFLHASEARHVEWAWSQGLLREYSAWAVALGEADAWSKALDRANVPEPARVVAAPILVDRMGSSVRSSTTAPSSSGSGGGFSGGGSGGGGGGGSSGSW